MRVTCDKRLAAPQNLLASAPAHDGGDDEHPTALARAWWRGVQLRVDDDGRIVASRSGARKRTV